MRRMLMTFGVVLGRFAPRITRGQAARAGLAVVVLLGIWQAAAAAEPAQQLWLINTRCAPRCGDCEGNLEQLSYWQLDASCNWAESDASRFIASGDAAAPTTVFVHGYDINDDEAVEEGWSLYQRMQAQAGDRPFRLVIWSWPSERSQRLRTDLRVKASWSNTESCYLANSLAKLKAKTPVSLIGYSLGARVVGGAIHLLAGGELGGRVCSTEVYTAWKSSPRPVRAVLIAAAMDVDWLMPGHRNGLVVSAVEEMLVTQNCCDRALRWYPRLNGRRGPQAIGRVGPIVADGDKVTVLDVTCSVGREHNWYLYEAAVAPYLGRYTFLEDAK